MGAPRRLGFAGGALSGFAQAGGGGSLVSLSPCVAEKTYQAWAYAGGKVSAAGVGALVDADMNEESTKLQALQVQQQLGVQELSISNPNSQQILSLFQG